MDYDVGIVRRRRIIPADECYFAVPSGGWTPINLPGLLAWYDAAHTPITLFTDAGVTPATADNSVIKQWNDSGPHGYNLTKTTSTAEPWLRTNVLNGLGALDSKADGGHTGIGTSGTPVSLGGTAVSCFCVFNKRVAGGANRLVSVGNGTDDTTATFNINDQLTTAYRIAMIGTADAGDGVQAAVGSFAQIGFTFDGATVNPYTGNVLQTAGSASGTLASSVDIALMCRATSLDLADTAQIAEIVFTTNAMSTADRGNLHTYFLNKWGV